MKYSYTDKTGKEVEVSERHLKVALSIKLELQADSASRRCNWKRHRKLMEEQGFSDSEASENYRCMIKYYQTKHGLMPKLDDNKIPASSELKAIQSLVGELATEKRDNQNVLRELNKAKRRILDGNLYTKSIIESLETIFKTYEFPSTPTVKPITINKGSKALAMISDWHIGALVETKTNSYNYEIACSRIEQYAVKLAEHCRINKIKEVEVVFMGDLVEGAFMRASQGYDVEFTTAEQIVKASDLIIRLLNSISLVAKVTYRAFSGNHDRMNQADKGNNIHGDSVVVVSNKIVETYINAKDNPNLNYATADLYGTNLELNGVDIKLVHGDLEKKVNKNKIHEHSSMDCKNYKIIAYGHFHHFNVAEIGHNRFEVVVGSIKGTDDYAERFKLESAPSQAIITVSKDGEIDIKRVGLK